MDPDAPTVFIVDDDDTTLVRVRTETDGTYRTTQDHWLLLQEEPKLVEAEGFSTDATLALVTYAIRTKRRPPAAETEARLRNVVMVDGSGLAVNGQDLAARARKPKVRSVFTVEQ